MSFEIKYNRDGQVITPAPQQSNQEHPIEQPIQSLEASPEEPIDNSVEEIEEQEVAVEAQPVYQKQNFNTLRQEKERAARERDEALMKLKAYEMQVQMQQSQQRPPPAAEPEEELEFNLPDDEMLEAKHVAPLVKEIKKLRSEVKQTQQRSAQMTEESKLLAKYPDYYSVVSQENIALLQSEDPELAQVLGTSTDIYGAKAMAYKAIKKMSAPKEEPAYNLEKALIAKNSAKPKPLASLSPQQGDSALSRANAFANGLTPELQKQLRKEMADAMRNN